MIEREPEWNEVSSAPPPPIARIYARARRHRAMRWSVGAVALAAAALLALRPGEGGRDRGVGQLPLVSLEAVAESAQSGARPLVQRAQVGASERVVFFVRSSGPGEATLREHGPGGSVTVWPQQGSWALPAGEHTPGGEQPLSWRPDRGPGDYRYELRVCPEAYRSDCAVSWLELAWAP